MNGRDEWGAAAEHWAPAAEEDEVGAAAEVGSEGSVLCSDFSPEMVKVAGER